MQFDRMIKQRDNDHMKTAKLLLIFCFLFSLNVSAQNADPGRQKTREFLMSCTYGILTGTLVGAASLAFTDSPGDNLHRVARGASLGLYAGIALGYYITTLDDQPELPPEYQDGDIPPDLLPQSNQMQIIPRFSNHQLDGLEIRWSALSF